MRWQNQNTPRKLVAERGWSGCSGEREPRDRDTGLLAGGQYTHPGRRVWAGPAGGGAGRAEDAGASGTPGRPDIGAWQQPRPALSLTPRGKGTGLSAAWRGGRAPEECPLGSGKAARPRAFLPVQAEGAAPPVEQAEQQERGPRQRGVSRRQVLAEGRHGTSGASERASERAADAAVTAGVQEARRRLGGEERGAGGAGRAGPPPGARPSPPRSRLGGARAAPRRPEPSRARSAHARTHAESPGTRARRNHGVSLGASLLLRGRVVIPASPLRPLPHTHTQAFTRTGKAGKACAGNSWDPPLRPRTRAVTTLLKEPWEREMARRRALPCR